jgi:hypothetical protein
MTCRVPPRSSDPQTLAGISANKTRIPLWVSIQTCANARRYCKLVHPRYGTLSCGCRQEVPKSVPPVRIHFAPPTSLMFEHSPRRCLKRARIGAMRGPAREIPRPGRFRRTGGLELSAIQAWTCAYCGRESVRSGEGVGGAVRGSEHDARPATAPEDAMARRA